MDRVLSPMTDQQKSEWVSALRSGKFKQGTAQLKREIGDGTFEYCCLGVAEKVLNLGSHSIENLAISNYGESEPIFLDFDLQASLAGMNDRGLVFNTIAGYIEQNVNVQDRS